MSFTANLQYDSEKELKYVRLSCRLLVPVADFVNLSGNIYYTSVTRGPVPSVKVNGTALTLGTSGAGLTANQFYYDRDLQRLYINVNTILTNQVIVPTIYLFLANEATLWYETPDDDTTPVVSWAPLLQTSPSFKLTIPAKGFGYMPVDQSSLIITNDGSFNYLLGNGSFRRTACEVWHQLGDQETANIRKHLTGVLGLRVSVRDDQIVFDVADKSLQFDRLISGRSMSAVSALDPRFNNTVCMKIIGASSGMAAAGYDFAADAPNYEPEGFFEMANMDYDADAPTTSNNRKFGLIYDPDGATYPELSMSGTMKPGGANNFQASNTDLHKQLRVGDIVWFDGAADQYLEVNVATSVVEFTTVPSGGSNQAGSLRRSIFDVYLVKDGITPKRLKYGRDFTQTIHVTNILGITLTSTAEANNGVATFDPVNDQIWCVPLGRATQLTFDGNNVGGAHQYKSGEKVLLQFLKDEAGLSEDEIDWDSISAILPYVPYQIFVPMPYANFTEYPQVRDVLDLILKSLLVRGFFNNEGKFTVKPYLPITTTDETFAKEQILADSYEYEIDYSEIKNLYLLPAWRSRARVELGYTGTKDDFLAGTQSVQFVNVQDPAYESQATPTSISQHLHENEVNEVFEHLVATDYVNEPFENRIRDLYAQRDGTCRIQGKRLGLLRSSGDLITLSRDALVGYDDETGLTAAMQIVEIEKADDRVDILLNDNKAAQDMADETYWDPVE